MKYKKFMQQKFCRQTTPAICMLLVAIQLALEQNEMSSGADVQSSQQPVDDHPPLVLFRQRELNARWWANDEKSRSMQNNRFRLRAPTKPIAAAAATNHLDGYGSGGSGGGGNRRTGSNKCVSVIREAEITSSCGSLLLLCYAIIDFIPRIL